MLRIYSYSVTILENTDQKNSEYGYFSRSVINCFFVRVKLSKRKMGHDIHRNKR